MTTRDPLEAEYDDLLFTVRRSVRYHRHRESFLDRVHQLGALLTAVAASATVATLLAELPVRWTWMPLLTASVAALGGATELAFGPARAARRHDSLAVSFLALEKELLRAGRSLTPEILVELQSRRLDLEAGEPPVYRVLNAICHDELATAMGIDPSQRSNVTGWQRLWRHFVDVGAHRIRNRQDDRFRGAA